MSEPREFVSLDGRNLRIARAKQGLTQEGLAEKCGISNKVISRAERGIGTVEVKTAERIAKALEVEVDNLIKTVENREVNASSKTDPIVELLNKINNTDNMGLAVDTFVLNCRSMVRNVGKLSASDRDMMQRVLTWTLGAIQGEVSETAPGEEITDV